MPSSVEWFRCCCFHGGRLWAVVTRAAAGRTRKRPRRRLRVTALVRLPPTGVRVRAVHAENGGVLPSGLPVAGGSFAGPGRSGAPHATRMDTPTEIPVLRGTRSADPRGWPVSRALVAVSGGSNCQQGRWERERAQGPRELAWALSVEIRAWPPRV